MPRTGALLTAEERGIFADWLRDRIGRAPIGKSALAARLGQRDEGDDSTARLNRYIRDVDPQLPTPLVLGTLAAAINVAWPVAFFYAGHFPEILGAIERLAAARNFRRLIDRRAVMMLALEAFPRRDVRPSPLFTTRQAASELEVQLSFQDDLARLLRGIELFQLDEESVAALTRRLNPFFASASAVLRDRTLSPAYRRFIAAEYVNAWADDRDLALARDVRTQQAGRQRLADAIIEQHDRPGGISPRRKPHTL